MLPIHIILFNLANITQWPALVTRAYLDLKKSVFAGVNE